MIDFTPIINCAMGIISTLILAVFSAWLAKHMSDKQAAAAVENALKNGLGAMQQAVQSGLSTHPLQVQMPHVSAPMAAGVQYVINQVPGELKQLSISKDQVADKLDARLGNRNIDTNVATASSPAPTPQPLAPVPNPSQPAASPVLQGRNLVGQ